MSVILSACMIVKNGAQFLPKVLPNLVAGCDEVILVDTGSSDNTVTIALELGAKVYHFPWINDFAAARNESIKYAAGKWILWIDADEYLKLEHLSMLRNVLATLPQISKISVRIYECDLFETAETGAFYYRDKVFKNVAGARFERAINEQLLLPAQEKDQELMLKDISIYHWGRALKQEELKQKNETRIEMYKDFIAQHIDDLPAYLMLARKYFELELENDAQAMYEKIIEITRGRGRFALEAYLRLADILIKEEKLTQALELTQKAYEIDETNAEAVCAAAGIYLKLKQFDKVLIELEKIDRLDPGQATHLIVNIRFYDYYPYLYRTLAYLYKREIKLAAKNLGLILEKYPEDKTAHQLLGKSGGLN